MASNEDEENGGSEETSSGQNEWTNYHPDDIAEALTTTELPFVRYCNVTFCREGTIEDEMPVKLMRCTRCQATYYRSRTEQQQHWKVHKKLCKPPSDFENLRQTIFASNTLEAIMLLEQALSSQTEITYVPTSPRAGYTYLWVLQRLEQLSKQGDYSSYGRMIGLGRDLMLMPNRQVELLWAIPGMANYLLNLDIRSQTVRCMIWDTYELPSMGMLAAEYHRPNFHENMDFLSFVGFILAGSAFSDTMHGEMNPQYRKDFPVAYVATRKVMEWCSDPWSLVSTPLRVRGSDEIQSAREGHFKVLLDLVFQDLPNEGRGEDEVAPGLTTEGTGLLLLWTIVADYYRLRPCNVKKWVKCLYLSVEQKPSAWKAFSVESRAKWAHFIARYLIFGSEANGGISDLSKDFKDISHLLMTFMTGWRVDMSLWLRVVREASHGYVESVFFAEWCEKILNEVRPAVKYAIRQSGLVVPSEIETLICEFCLPTDSNSWEQSFK